MESVGTGLWDLTVLSRSLSRHKHRLVVHISYLLCTFVSLGVTKPSKLPRRAWYPVIATFFRVSRTQTQTFLIESGSPQQSPNIVWMSLTILLSGTLHFFFEEKQMKVFIFLFYFSFMDVISFTNNYMAFIQFTLNVQTFSSQETIKTHIL